VQRKKEALRENKTRRFRVIGVGCALAAQLRAREQTWRDKHTTYIDCGNPAGISDGLLRRSASWNGGNEEADPFHTVSGAVGG